MRSCRSNQRKNFVRGVAQAFQISFGKLESSCPPNWMLYAKSKISFRTTAFMLCSRSLIHLPFSRAFRTDLFFLLLCICNSGNKDAGERPSIQLDHQNEALFPLCTVTLVAAAKRDRSTLSTGTCIPIHGCCMLSQWSQSHLNRRALLKRSRSRISNPPNSTGLATIGQDTLHFPPDISASPAQRKRLLILSSSARNCFGTLTEVSR